jgi:hypothetical protein
MLPAASLEFKIPGSKDPFIFLQTKITRLLIDPIMTPSFEGRPWQSEIDPFPSGHSKFHNLGNQARRFLSLSGAASIIFSSI